MLTPVRLPSAAAAYFLISCGGGAKFQMVETPWSASDDATARLTRGAEQLGCKATPPDSTGEIGLAVLVWAGFQLGGFAGSVLHEGYPLRLYAIHMGDALLKAVVASFVIAGLAGRLT